MALIVPPGTQARIQSLLHHCTSNFAAKHLHLCSSTPFVCCAAVYVVFGATGGIGSALAHRLAKHPGAALVLVGRDQNKVQASGLSVLPALIRCGHCRSTLHQFTA